jgi:hypothetical protein
MTIPPVGIQPQPTVAGKHRQGKTALAMLIIPQSVTLRRMHSPPMVIDLALKFGES